MVDLSTYHPWSLARHVFQPKKGFEWLLADYSQVEMRIYAHFCKDPNYLEAIRTGKDLHTYTASLMYGVSMDLVVKMMRAFGKILNFTIIYGGGINKIAKALQFGSAQNDPLTVAEAQRALLVFDPFALPNALADPYEPLARALKAAYDREFVVGKKFNSDVRQVIQDRYYKTGMGYVRTAFGLTIPVPVERAYAGVNYIIQGTAAGLIKLALTRSWQACLQFAKLKGLTPWEDISVIMSIHDENIYECPKGMAVELAKAIQPALTTWPEFIVPIPVDFAWVPEGSSWAFKKSLDLTDEKAGVYAN